MRTRREPLAGMLKLWYGSRRGAVEMLTHLPEPESLSSVLDRLSSRMMSKNTFRLFILRDKWHSIAGPELARRTMPSFLSSVELSVEVSHPSWLRELKSTHVKNAIISKVNEALDGDFCKSIAFHPAGRTPRQT